MAEEIVQQQEVKQKNDEVLDKYLQKKNFNKKLTFVFALSVALILALVVLLLSLLPVSVRPQFLIQDNPREYEVVIDSKTKTFNYEDEEYQKITGLFNQAFSMSVLRAMFTGQTGNYTLSTDYNLFKTSSLTSYLGNCNSYLHVKFERKDFVIKNSDGSVFDGVGVNDSLFGDFYVALPDGNMYQQVVIVIPTYGNAKPDGNKVDASVPLLEKLTVNINVFNLKTALKDM